jgi:hypothetical protein
LGLLVDVCYGLGHAKGQIRARKHMSFQTLLTRKRATPVLELVHTSIGSPNERVDEI